MFIVSLTKPKNQVLLKKSFLTAKYTKKAQSSQRERPIFQFFVIFVYFLCDLCGLWISTFSTAIVQTCLERPSKIKTCHKGGRFLVVGVDPASAGPTLPTFSRDALNTILSDSPIVPCFSNF